MPCKKNKVNTIIKASKIKLRFSSIFYIAIYFSVHFWTNIDARSLEENRYCWQSNGPTYFKIPQNFQPKKAKLRVSHNDYFSIRLLSRRFQRGDIVYFELTPKDLNKGQFSVVFQSQKIDVHYRNHQASGFFALPPSSKSGKYPLAITYLIKGGKSYKKTILVPILYRKFSRTSFSIRLSDKKTPDRILRKIARNRKLKKRIFENSSKNSYFNNAFALPRDYFYITSDFWQQRKIRYYRIANKKRKTLKKVHNRVHRGVDLRGFVGNPIFAIARGRVVLAKQMYYEGRFIVIDHGSNIFSGYMHMSKIKTYVGRIVEAGEKIGESGATGRITGPHLHLFLKVNNVNVDPLSIFGIPVTGFKGANTRQRKQSCS